MTAHIQCVCGVAIICDPLYLSHLSAPGLERGLRLLGRESPDALPGLKSYLVPLRRGAGVYACHSQPGHNRTGTPSPAGRMKRSKTRDFSVRSKAALCWWPPLKGRVGGCHKRTHVTTFHFLLLLNAGIFTATSGTPPPERSAKLAEFFSK